jgi:hypothetical protein
MVTENSSNRKVAGSVSDYVIGFFHWHNPSSRTGVVSVPNRNKYQEYFLGVKAAGAYGWQLYYLYLPFGLKSGSLNFLETSGPVQACNGIALPLPYIFFTSHINKGLDYIFIYLSL